MNEKEAIKEAIEILQISKIHLYAFSDSIAAIDMAIEALEKQIPKKPKVEVEGSVEFGGCYGVYFCPSCYEYEGNKKWKRKIIYDQDYCDVCGQRIDWSEVEE